MIKYLFIVLSSLVLLSGCNKTEIKEKTEKVSTVKNAEAKEDGEQSNSQIITYFDKVNSGLTPLSKNLQDAVEVIGMGMKDHDLTYSEQYIETVELISDEMQKNIDTIRLAQRGDVESLEATHEVLLELLEEYEFVAENMYFAVGGGVDEVLAIECLSKVKNSAVIRIQLESKMSRILEDIKAEE